MAIKEILNITFNEEGFKTPEEPQVVDKPEFKKFNMKFHNLDLLMIDAIAKRDGTSRSQIINMFIDKILRDSLISLPGYIGLTIGKAADRLCDEKGKSNKDFSWEHWVIEQVGWVRSHKDMIGEYYLQIEGIDFNNKETIPPDLSNLYQIFNKHFAKLKEAKSETAIQTDNEH